MKKLMAVALVSLLLVPILPVAAQAGGGRGGWHGGGGGWHGGGHGGCCWGSGWGWAGFAAGVGVATLATAPYWYGPAYAYPAYAYPAYAYPAYGYPAYSYPAYSYPTSPPPNYVRSGRSRRDDAAESVARCDVRCPGRESPVRAGIGSGRRPELRDGHRGGAQRDADAPERADRDRLDSHPHAAGLPVVRSP